MGCAVNVKTEADKSLCFTDDGMTTADLDASCQVEKIQKNIFKQEIFSNSNKKLRFSLTFSAKIQIFQSNLFQKICLNRLFPKIKWVLRLPLVSHMQSCVLTKWKTKSWAILTLSDLTLLAWASVSSKKISTKNLKCNFVSIFFFWRKQNHHFSKIPFSFSKN